MVGAVRELANYGQLQKGAVIHLENVPIPFLQEAPLVDGQWLDRHVVALAEWGALLRINGYQVNADEDEHPLSAGRFLAGDERETIESKTEELRQLAGDHVTAFVGRSRDIDGRPYLHFEDYCAWRECQVTGDVRGELREGLVTACWNAWVQAQGGEGAATVAGVLVESLTCHVERCHYQVCPNGAEDVLKHRRGLLDGMRVCESKSERESEFCQDWKDAAECFLAELYAFREGTSSASGKYFDGQPVLFTDAARDLDKVIKDAEELVGRFNSDFSKEADRGLQINLEALRPAPGKNIAQPVAFLVDLAKAEALYQLGEQPAAMELVERYL
jgi:hypothetical protein